MDENRYLEEIARLEKERELLLSLLSGEERQQFEDFKKRFSETDHSQSMETGEEEKEDDKNQNKLPENRYS